MIKKIIILFIIITFLISLVVNIESKINRFETNELIISDKPIDSIPEISKETEIFVEQKDVTELHNGPTKELTEEPVGINSLTESEIRKIVYKLDEKRLKLFAWYYIERINDFDDVSFPPVLIYDESGEFSEYYHAVKRYRTLEDLRAALREIFISELADKFYYAWCTDHQISLISNDGTEIKYPILRMFYEIDGCLYARDRQFNDKDSDYLVSYNIEDLKIKEEFESRILIERIKPNYNGNSDEFLEIAFEEERWLISIPWGFVNSDTGERQELPLGL